MIVLCDEDLAEAKHSEWKARLDLIEHEVNELVTYRFVFQYVREIIQGNPDLPPSHFLWVMGGMYADSQVIALRRLVDRDTRTESLFRLMDDICKHAECVTRRRFMSLYGTDGEDPTSLMAKIAEDAFTEHAGAGETLDPRIIESHISRLDEAAARVKEWANKRIAHYDGRVEVRKPDAVDPSTSVETVNIEPEERGIQPPTFAEVHAAIDVVYEIFTELLLLLRATSRAAVVPIFQYDWDAIFRLPWLHPDFDPPRPD